MEEQKRNVEVARRKQRINNDLIPLLQEIAPTIEEVRIFSSGVQAVIQQIFNKGMITTTLRELEIVQNIHKDSVNKQKFERFVDMFGDESLVAIFNMIEGVPYAIDIELQKENTKRKFSDLNISL